MLASSQRATCASRPGSAAPASRTTLPARTAPQQPQRAHAAVTWPAEAPARCRRNARACGARNTVMATAAAGRDATPEVLDLWRRAKAVCFDVDSTVCTDEGIDELAAFCGAGEAVAALTARAMGGSVPFQDALAARLELINPSAPTVATFLAQHPPRLSPGIAELVAALHAGGKAVFLVSGGFTQMIHPVADALRIPRERVFANTLLFADGGAFAGFDKTAFTSRSGGKAAAIKHIKAESGGSLAPMVMIGDGATDLEARMPGGADLFIGYGGVAKRAVVMEGADWFVTSFTPLIEGLR